MLDEVEEVQHALDIAEGKGEARDYLDSKFCPYRVVGAAPALSQPHEGDILFL